LDYNFYFIPGTGGEIIDPGTKGTILGNIKKMVGKAYEVKLEDGRKFFIHSAIINNQTEVIKD